MRETVYTILGTESIMKYNNPCSCDWGSFPWTNGYFTHRISKREIERPYLISSQYYGTVDYEDVILLINNIAHIFDVVPGTELKIPKIQDLRKFLLDNKT